LLTSCSRIFELFPEDNGADGNTQWWLGPLLAVATLTSEDLACVTAGVLASPERGLIPYWYAVIWCWAGILIGDIGLYSIGWFMGPRAAKLPFLRRFLTEKNLQKSESKLRSHFAWVLFTTRFVPGTRIPAYVGAGIIKYSVAKFALFLGIAGLLWTPIIVGFATYLGHTLMEWLGLYEKYALLGVVAVILIIWLIWELIMPLFTHRGRRLQLARWYRLVEWEFWPMWAVYTPVVLYLGWLSLKHRCLLAFTAVNPAIPHSGLALESKSQILAGLQGSRPDRDPRIPRWTLIPGDAGLETKLDQLQEFLSAEGLDFPFVLKPDVGERGQGVAVIREMAEAEHYLEACPEPVIAQEFAPGEEFGVFYYRHPEAEQGQIFSITHKKLVQVTGNGKDTLERLILDDKRALRMAKFFFKKHEDLLETVPAKGEKISLTDLGTHCRGALFLDGREHITEALRASIDELSHQFEGFHFGRYDLRAPSVEALREGRDLKIIELNGVSSEATHIYQPGYPLWRGYADLMRQWTIAYNIGAANIRAGAKSSTLGEIRALVREHKKKEWFEAPCPSAAEEVTIPSD